MAISPVYLAWGKMMRKTFASPMLGLLSLLLVIGVAGRANAQAGSIAARIGASSKTDEDAAQSSLQGSNVAADGYTQSVLYSFCIQANCSDGRSPEAGIIQGSDGNFYGTTWLGGANNEGIVFRLTPAGALTTLYSFCSKIGCSDGARPRAALIQGTDGNFYGTTTEGGVNGNGTVFKLTPAGILTTLYKFCSQANCTDGGDPEAALIEGSDGNFYGTTKSGGATEGGTVFKLTPGGVLTTLYSFCGQANCSDGFGPTAAVIQGSDGNFYGTTQKGGLNISGTVFKLTPAGILTTLYKFCSQTNCSDGKLPSGALIQGSDGNLYGTTDDGGSNLDYGTVFKLTPGGVLTTLYSFCSQANCSDGFYPEGGVIQGNDGNFYGTTWLGGGDYLGGTVFKLAPGGVLTTLYSFCSQLNCSDGEGPGTGVIQASDGNFYGTTVSGQGDAGTVFELSANPAFFNGEASVGSGWYYLAFSNGNFFGYYNYQFWPWLYHTDMEFEYFVAAVTGNGAYLYDSLLGQWFYTDPSSFPYLYNFTAGAWYWYEPDQANPGHYSSNPRWFVNMTTGKWIHSP